MRESITGLYQIAAQALAPAALNLEVANAAAIEVRHHFRLLDATRPNKLGGRRTHFWGQYAKTVVPRADAERAIVAIEDPQAGASGASPLLHHYQGGTITAKPGKALTIPAVPEAHGTRAREWNNLHFAILGGKAALLENAATNIRIGKKGVKAVSSQFARVIFWLVKSVTHRPDPTVVPSAEVLLLAAHNAVSRIVRRVATQGGVA
jgi:hypothetical protein